VQAYCGACRVTVELRLGVESLIPAVIRRLWAATASERGTDAMTRSLVCVIGKEATLNSRDVVFAP
jgi:hypothetical protein